MNLEAKDSQAIVGKVLVCVSQTGVLVSDGVYEVKEHIFFNIQKRFLRKRP